MKDLEAEIVSYSKLNMKNVAKGVTLDMATREPKLLRYSTVFHCYESLEATIRYSLQYSTVLCLLHWNGCEKMWEKTAMKTDDDTMITMWKLGYRKLYEERKTWLVSRWESYASVQPT